MLACAQALPQRAARALIESAAAVLGKANVAAEFGQVPVDACPPDQETRRVQVDTCPLDPDDSEDVPGLESGSEYSECSEPPLSLRMTFRNQNLLGGGSPVVVARAALTRNMPEREWGPMRMTSRRASNT